MKINEHDLRKSQFSYFLGRKVTILATAAAATYPSDERGCCLYLQAYSGLCEGFDEYGVWLQDVQTEAKSFFFYSQIQGILENPMLSEDHPIVKEAMNKVKKETGPVVLGKDGPSIIDNENNYGELSIEEFQKLLTKNRS